MREKVAKMTDVRNSQQDVIGEEYASSLADLTVNSKPLINMLTMLAEENAATAPVIVKVIEKHLSQVYIHLLSYFNKYFSFHHCLAQGLFVLDDNHLTLNTILLSPYFVVVLNTWSYC